MRGVWGHAPFLVPIFPANVAVAGACLCQRDENQLRRDVFYTQAPRAFVKESDTGRRILGVQASRETKLLLLFFSYSVLARFAAVAMFQTLHRVLLQWTSGFLS